MKRFIRQSPSGDKNIIEVDGNAITQYSIRYGKATKKKVLDCKAVKDGMPDIYTLINPKNGKKYEFIPHNGLKAI